MKKPKVFVIVGPTSSGKSALAVEMARKINGEVISADSRQVYKGLDIGTGKITKREMKGVTHHLLDITSPKTVFTAADFVLRGRKAIEDIVKRGKVPIVCGGTGFYIDALLGRVSLPNVSANKTLRKQLANKSAQQLYAILKQLDPRRGKSIDKNNPVRLVRAIEIAKKLGKVPVLSRSNLDNIFNLTWIGLKPDNTTLQKKIHTRLRARLKEGMVREAERLHTNGLSYARMEQLGLEYRYLAHFLQRKIAKTEMLADLEHDIRRYAKRQMTYWRRNRNIRWIHPSINILHSLLQSFAKH